MYELIYYVLHYNIVRASPLIRSPKQLIKRTLRSIIYVQNRHLVVHMNMYSTFMSTKLTDHVIILLISDVYTFRLL